MADRFYGSAKLFVLKNYAAIVDRDALLTVNFCDFPSFC